MRILLIVPVVTWPIASGGDQRTFAVLRALAAEHDVVLTGLLPKGETDEDSKLLTRECERALAPFTKAIIWAPQPDALEHEPVTSSRIMRAMMTAWNLVMNPIPLVYRARFSAWSRLVTERASEFDAVVVRGTALAHVAAGVPGHRVILDADDQSYMFLSQRAELYSGLFRFSMVLEVARTKRYEFSAFARVRRVLVANAEDAARLRRANVSILSNGVTLDGVPSVQRGTKTLVYVGHFGWLPNLEGLWWFLDHVWSDVLLTVPDARLNVVGRKATSDIAGDRPLVGLHFEADVPEVGSWFAGAVASIVPLWEGSGTRIKIIESLGYCTPVISTPIGAAGLTSDFDESDGLFIAQNKEQMIEKILDVLRNPHLAAQAAQLGSKKVRSRWTWQARTETLASQITDLIATVSA